MPIYEYKCQNCGHYFEVLQRISEEPLIACTECKKNALKKLISAPNFRLKGGGWYETDFKKENQKNLAEQQEEKSRIRKKNLMKQTQKNMLIKRKDQKIKQVKRLRNIMGQILC